MGIFSIAPCIVVALCFFLYNIFFASFLLFFITLSTLVAMIVVALLHSLPFFVTFKSNKDSKSLYNTNTKAKRLRVKIWYNKVSIAIIK